MDDITSKPYGRFVPAAYIAWVQKRPILNNIIALAAGAVLGHFFW